MSTRSTLCLLALILCAAPTRAADKQVCLDAHAQAQQLRKRGQFGATRETLAACARATCPPLVERDCTTWREELEREQPSVVLSVRDPQGHDATAVRVLVDGKPLAEALDGRPLPVDPGERTFRFVLPDGVSHEERVLVRTSEKGRMIRVAFQPIASAPLPPAPSPRESPSTPEGTPERHGLPALAYVFGGVSIVSFGAWAFFGVSGKNLESKLAGSCAPNCEKSDIATVRRDYLAADVALGVGIVSLGVATWIALSSLGGSTSSRATSTRTELDVTLGGASLRGTF